MSTLKTTNLQHASAASPAIVLASDGTATAQLSSLNGGALSGARNRIINGDMRIDQRNAGASVTLSTTTQYPVDRFPAYKATSGATLTAQRSTTAPAGFTNSIIFTASTGATPAAGDINAFWQFIEGFNVADLGWGTASAQSITVSFWVRSSITGTYSFSLNNNASNRFYVATYAVNTANTWEYKTVTIAGDTSGTWLTDNSTGIQVTWDLGYGSNFNGSAGAWGSSLIRRTSGSVQLITTTGATFYITGIQVESGSTATPFERRSYGQELALCQRYFETAGGVYLQQTRADTGTKIVGTILFTVVKRASPTASITTNAINVTPTGTWTELMSGYPARTGTINASATGFSYIDFGATTGNPINGSWIASAEL